MIRLGQLLKLTGVIDSGAEVKSYLSSAVVTVNGQREERRGRQLRAGDTVRTAERSFQVIAEKPQTG